MPFKAFYLSPQGELRRGLDEAAVKAAYDSGQGLLWVNIHDTAAADGDFLARCFGFHRLPIDDCVSPLLHPPKIDDFGRYLFIVVHGINQTAESNLVETMELALFLGPNFVVSNHNFPLFSVEAILHQAEEDGRPLRRGADFLAHTLMDSLIDHIQPTIDKMDERAAELSEEVIHHPQPVILESILQLKRSAVRLHRTMIPQREVLNRLSRGEFGVIRPEAQIFYRDVYDHIMRIEYMSQTLMEMADNAVATYMSVVANRQNEAMKALATVTIIFLPLTLLAGIYGMNFEFMPELKWPWGYFVVVGFMGLVIVGALAWFWRSWWRNWGRRPAIKERPFAVEREKLAGLPGSRQGPPNANL